MKAGFLLVTALVLAVLCLGSASIAMAQSITGGGLLRDNPNNSLVSLSVVASPRGGIVQLTAGPLGFRLLGNVVDLCVVDNAAIAVIQITQSSVEGFPIGSFTPLVFEDNGKTGDRFGLFTGASEEFVPCSEIVEFLDFILATDADVQPLTRGNITITP